MSHSSSLLSDLQLIGHTYPVGGGGGVGNHSVSAQHSRMLEKFIRLCTQGRVGWPVEEAVDLAATDSDGREGRGLLFSVPHWASTQPFWQRRWRVKAVNGVCLQTGAAGGTEYPEERPSKESICCPPHVARDWSTGLRNPSHLKFPWQGCGYAQSPSAKYTPPSHSAATLGFFHAPTLSRKSALVTKTKKLCYSPIFWKTKGKPLFNLLNH